jgi:hypothetical protein
VGGNTISGSRWSLTPSTTNIFYNSGNVGIGTNSATNKIQIIHTSTSTDPANNSALYVYNSTNSSGQNSIIANRIAGSASGKVLYSFDVNGTHGYSIYMVGNNSVLKFNNNWGDAGTDVMTLNNDGNVGIGNNNPVY